MLRCLFLYALASLALVWSAQLYAQGPDPELLKQRWEIQRYEVVVQRTLTRSAERVFLRERRWADSMNLQIEYKRSRTNCEFHADSSYSYKQTFDKHVEYFERGTWSLSDSSLKAHSITHNERSMLDGSKILRLSSSELVLVFRLGKARDGLYQHIFFRRREELPDHD